jgi:pimeloyl-ACP methyl ester carboxylesterase
MKSFLEQVVRWTGAVSLAIALVSCGGGGGGATGPTTTISGVVSDDIIVGATVTATSIDTNSVLGSAITGIQGGFSISTGQGNIGSGYLLTSSGGTMNGQTFVGSLSAIYPATADPAAANLTLITTSLATAASTSALPGNLLQKHQILANSAISGGLIGLDYSSLSPQGTLNGFLQAQAATVGVSGATQSVGLSIIELQKPTPSPCSTVQSITTCSWLSGASEPARTLTILDGSIVVPAGSLKSTKLVATFDSVSHQLGLTVTAVQSAPSTAGSTPQLPTIDPPTPITVTLPTSLSQVPVPCLKIPILPLQSDLIGNAAATSMPYCVQPAENLFSAHYRLAHGGKHHYLDNPTNSLSLGVGSMVSLSRVFDATLHASIAPQSVVKDQWTGKTAVIFVHGFTPDFQGYGGNDGTWGKLPNLVMRQYPDTVALNFQWKTDSSYLTVSQELAKAVDYAELSTGKKVHIVAHSFGGVLARVMLQNLAGNTSGAALKVATLITVGSPHSGIATSEASVGGAILPDGWGAFTPSGKVVGLGCEQITCYQSGMKVDIAEWAVANLVNTTTDTGNGYVTRQLVATRDNLPPGLKMRVLIGQIIEGTTFHNGDGLISYYGQRFAPTFGSSPLAYDAPVTSNGAAGARVTERILGLIPKLNALPGAPVGSLTVSPYSLGKGYKHNGFAGVTGVNVGVWDSWTAVPEVNVPNDCYNAADCLHDTWVNLKEFWDQNPICLPAQVIQGQICVTPTVSSVLPLTATASTANTFTVTGQNLPLNAVMALAGGSCQTPTQPQTASGFSVVCTPGAATGSQVVTIGTAASGGTVIDATRSIVVSAIPAISVPASVSASASDGQATLTWASVPGATSYNIYMASVAGVTRSNYSSLTGGAKISGVTSPHTISGLTNGVTYYFVVTAVNASAESTESTTVMASPQLVALPPFTITEFSSGITGTNPNFITASTDGNLWFTEHLGNIVGRITTAGVITEFNAGPNNGDLWGITSSLDGSLWFPGNPSSSITNMNSTGMVTEFPTGTPNTNSRPCKTPPARMNTSFFV